MAEALPRQTRVAHHRSWGGDWRRGVAEALPRRKEGAGSTRDWVWRMERGREGSTLFSGEKETEGGESLRPCRGGKREQGRRETG
eukprot:3459101-Rhodomonas_salina.1